MRWFLAPLLVFAPAQDPSASDMLQSLRDRAEKARTIRIEFSLDFAGERVAGTTKAKGPDRWSIEFTAAGEGGRMVCDGRKIVRTGKWDERRKRISIAAVGEDIRRSVATSFLLPVLSAMGALEDGERIDPAGVKDGGTETVDGRKLRVIEYTISALKSVSFGRESIQVRLFVDPSNGAPVKREIRIWNQQVVETVTAFALDEEMPDSDFSFQSRRGLARAACGQVARSVELYARFTGRHPETPEDLVRRPERLEPEVFWPDGGFVLGAVPKDPWGNAFELRRGALVCLGADGKPGGAGDAEDIAIELPAPSRRPVGAPTERLQRHYSARVRVHLLAAAVRAFHETYGEMPGRKSILWEKPAWAEVWPEGGWCPLGKVPDDPWGEPYRIVSDETWVRVQVRDPRSRRLTPKMLTEEERRRIEEIWQPRFSDAERKEIAGLMDRLSEDDLEIRDAAEAELRRFGPGVAALIEERLKTERDADARARMNQIVQSFPRAKPVWLVELAGLSTIVGSRDGVDMTPEERNALGTLKTLVTAQADFRANDRDENKVNDFWTGDVAGLYAITDSAGNHIKLIEVSAALADAEPLAANALKSGRYPKAITGFGAPAAYHGYRFRALREDKQVTANGGNGVYRQDTDGSEEKLHNTSRFGLCAYPEEYGVAGTRTFIVNEGNTLFWRDLEGETLPDWPTDEELAAEWHKMD